MTSTSARYLAPMGRLGDSLEPRGPAEDNGRYMQIGCLVLLGIGVLGGLLGAFGFFE